MERTTKEELSWERDDATADEAPSQPKVVTPEKPSKKPENDDTAHYNDDEIPDAPVSNDERKDEDDDRKPEARTTNQHKNEEGAPVELAVKEEEDAVTADSIMGFHKYPNKTNREIMLHHYGFVRWARSRENMYGRLEEFVRWSKSDEAKALEMQGLQGRGNEQFTYGQHNGKTFHQIAEQDPDYHVRYMKMLRWKNQPSNDMLDRYVEWFNQQKRGQKKKRKSTSNSTPADTAARRQRRAADNGNERFPFGQHRGQTFREIAEQDPSYHLRYKDMDDSPNVVLDRYIAWFDRYGPGPFVAHQSHHADLAYAAGLSCIFNNDDYDSEPF